MTKAPKYRVISEFQEQAPRGKKQSSMPWIPFTDEVLLGYALALKDRKALVIGGFRVRRLTVTGQKGRLQPLDRLRLRGTVGR